MFYCIMVVQAKLLIGIPHCMTCSCVLGSKNFWYAIAWHLSFFSALFICILVSNLLIIFHQVIAPQSASGVVLDAPEASKLLSAVAIALSNCSRWEGYQLETFSL